MLILHGRFDVFLSHGLHDELQIASFLQHTRAEIVPATVEDQDPQKSSAEDSASFVEIEPQALPFEVVFEALCWYLCLLWIANSLGRLA